MDDQWIVIGLGFAVALFLLIKYSNSALSKTFKCKGCGNVFSHTDRTRAASKRGFGAIYCNNCHTEHLKSKTIRQFILAAVAIAVFVFFLVPILLKQ